MKCDVCEKSYKTKNGLERHFKTHEVIEQLDGNTTLQIVDIDENETEINNDSITKEHNVTPSEKDSEKQTPFKVKVKVAADAFDTALNAVKLNILYILDTRIEPNHLRSESSFDLEELIENKFPHVFVFGVTLPEKIVYIDEQEFFKTGGTMSKDFLQN